jgi:Fe2+ or Zn2+ uptake regulation protein
MSSRQTEMLDELRKAGLKLTSQRIAVVREIADDCSHPTAQELFERLQPLMPTMSFATVYNTLDALVSAGLCTPRALSPGATRFDPNTAPHHHAVCDGCGLVIDLPIESKPNTRAVQVPHGFAVRAVEQIVRGSCAACAAASH